MQKWLKYLVYIALCYALLEAYRLFLHHGIKKNTRGFYGKINELVYGQNHYNTLIMGSSRAESHINPVILDSVLACNSFNIGIAGSYPTHQLVFLKQYLVHHPKPDCLIISADIHAYNGINDYQQLHQFYRYLPYLDEPVLYNGLYQIDPSFLGYKYFAPYALAFDEKDEKFNAAIRGYGSYVKGGLDYFKGFAYSPYGNQAFEASHKNVHKGIIPKECMQALQAIAKLCTNSNIKPILVYSPIHVSLLKQISNSVELRTVIAQQIPEAMVLDYTESSLSKKDQYFADPTHLNKKGALSFSLQLSDDLMQFFDKTAVKKAF
jgi:hypothetical protein